MFHYTRARLLVQGGKMAFSGRHGPVGPNAPTRRCTGPSGRQVCHVALRKKKRLDYGTTFGSEGTGSRVRSPADGGGESPSASGLGLRIRLPSLGSAPSGRGLHGRSPPSGSNRSGLRGQSPRPRGPSPGRPGPPGSPWPRRIPRRNSMSSRSVSLCQSARCCSVSIALI